MLQSAQHGEDPNIHNTARRCNLIWRDVHTLNKGVNAKCIRIPVKPTMLQGQDTMSLMNLFAYGNRFYRGGMRYVLYTNVRSGNKDLQVRVFHMPNSIKKAQTVEVFDAQYFKKWEDYEVDYAHEVQGTGNNRMISVDVPFFNPNTIIINDVNPNSIEDDLLGVNITTLGDLYFVYSDPGETTEIEISIYASVGDGAQFSTFQGFGMFNPYIADVIGVSSKPFTARNARNPPPNSHNVRKIVRAVPQMDVIAAGMGVLGTVGAVADTVSHVVHNVESAITTLFPGEDCDRPVETREGNHIIPRQGTSLSHGDGVYHGFNLRLDASKQVSMPQHIIPRGLEKDVVEMCKVRGFVDSFKINPDMAVDDIVWQAPNNPMLWQSKHGDFILPTPLSAVSSHFGYYSGGQNLTFMAVSSKVHQGRLRIVYVPDPSTYAANTVAGDECDAVVQPKNNYGQVWDISNNPEITFRIPDQVPLISNPIQKVDPDTGFRTIPSYGKIYVSIEGEFVTMESVAREIPIVVFASADKDFKLSVPVTSPLVRAVAPRDNNLRAMSVSLKIQTIPQSQERFVLDYEFDIDVHKSKESDSEVIYSARTTFTQTVSVGSLEPKWQAPNLTISALPCDLYDQEEQKIVGDIVGCYPAGDQRILTDQKEVVVGPVNMYPINSGGDTVGEVQIIRQNDPRYVKYDTADSVTIKMVLGVSNWTNPGFLLCTRVADPSTRQAVPEMHQPEGVREVVASIAKPIANFVSEVGEGIGATVPTPLKLTALGSVTGVGGVAGYALGRIIDTTMNVVSIGMDCSKVVYEYITTSIHNICESVAGISISDETQRRIIKALITLLKVIRSSPAKYVLVEFCSFIMNVLETLGYIDLASVFAAEATLTALLLSHDKILAEADYNSNQRKNLYKDYLVTFGVLICGMLGYSSKTSEGIKDTIYNIVDKVISGKALTFATITASVIKTMECIYDLIVGKDSEELKLLKEMEEQEDGIVTWAQEVNILCDPEFRATLLSSEQAQVRLKEAHYKSTVYFSKYCKLGKSEVSKVLLYFHSKLIKLYEEVGPSISKFDAHFDPFCIWLGGAPGIGKSTIVDKLMVDLMCSQGIVHDGSPIFTKNVQTEYWNLYNAQPGILFDDMLVMQDEESTRGELSNFLTIKSTAPFNAPCAAISDKKKLVTSKIIAVLSNHYYPKPNFIPDIKSVWRRRNVLAHVAYSDWMEENLWMEAINEPTPQFYTKYHEELKQNKHLKFGLMHPLEHTDPNSIKHWLTYDEFRAKLHGMFDAYYNSQMMTLQDRFKDFNPLSTKAWHERIVSGNVPAPILEKVKANIQDVGGADEQDQVSKEQLMARINTTLGVTNDTPNQIEAVPEMAGAGPLQFSSDRVSKYLQETAYVFNRVNKSVSITTTEPCYCPFVSMGEYDPSSEEVLLPVVSNTGEIDIKRVSYDEKCSMTCLRNHMTMDELITFKYEIIKNMDLKYLPEECQPSFVQRVKSKFVGVGAYMLDKLKSSIKSISNVIMDTIRSLPKYQILMCITLIIGAIYVMNKVYYSFFARESPPVHVTEDANFLGRLNKYYDCPATVYADPSNPTRTQTVTRVDDIVFPVLVNEEEEPENDNSRNPRTRKTKNPFKRTVVKVAGQSLDKYTKQNYVPKIQGREFKGIRPDNQRKGRLEYNNNKQVDSAQKLKSIVRNTILLETLAMDEDDQLLGGANIRGLAIKGRTVLVPYHFFEYFREIPDSVKLECSIVISDKTGFSSVVTVDHRAITYERIGEQDMVLAKLPMRVPIFKDISARFQRKEDAKNFSGRAIVYEQLLDPEGFTYMKLHETSVRRDALTIVYSDEFRFDLIGYSYPIHGNGMCGSLIINPRNFEICGMHVAGEAYGSTGWGVMLIREMFSDIAEMCADPDEYEDLVSDAAGMFVPGNNAIVVGKVSKIAFQQCKTSYKRTRCAEVLCAPVRSPCTLYDPEDKTKFPGYTALKAGVDRQTGINSRPFNHKSIQSAKDMLKNLLLTNCVPVKPVVSENTVEVAVNGLDGVPFFNKIRFDTSPGYPLNTLAKRGKNAYFEYDVGGDMVMRDELLTIYNMNHGKRISNIVPITLYQDVLKDEKLINAKAQRVDKTRLINACPLDLLIETRKYCLDFTAAMMNSRLDVMCGVGINPRGLDWNQLALRLLSKNDKLFDADYSNFGPGLDAELVGVVFDVINDWYEHNGADGLTEQHQQIRRILGHEAAFAHHIVHDTVFQTLKGSPSGHPMTTLINSLVNLLYIMIAWVEIMDGKYSAQSFFNHVYVCVYGDDLIGSVSPCVSSNFNASTFASFMMSHGIKVTPAEKQGFFTNTGMPIGEVTFLKHSFAKHPTRGIYQARLDKPIIEDIPNWYRPQEAGPISEEKMITILMEQSIAFAYAHGKEYYQSILSKCQKWCANNNIMLIYKTWEEYDRQCYEEDYVEFDGDEIFDLI